MGMGQSQGDVDRQATLCRKTEWKIEHPFFAWAFWCEVRELLFSERVFLKQKGRFGYNPSDDCRRSVQAFFQRLAKLSLVSACLGRTGHLESARFFCRRLVLSGL